MGKKWKIACGLALTAAVLAILIGIIEALPYLTGKPVIKVDFSTRQDEITAVNGINNGPKSGYLGEDQWELDVTEIYQELGIPYVRTHDSEYPFGSDQFIDIHCIFPEFSQDPEDPDAYNFEETDQYIAAIISSGAEVFYRLGESIAPIGAEIDEQWRERDYDQYISPPEDYEKWAQICDHIIQHYNEGWNNGYYYDIQYWEIWNEPDNGRMWTGSMEEFHELYRITARYLKERHPDIKIGGCGFSIVSEDSMLEFLQAITADGLKTPLDFFSWHIYSDSPWTFAQKGDMVRRILDEQGYDETISVLGEWNYVLGWQEEEVYNSWEVILSQKGASFIVASLLSMQEHSVDMAMYYDGQFVSDTIGWCGLYRSETELLPGYYAFSDYEKLMSKEWKAEISGSRISDEIQNNVYICAASGDTNGILLTNYASENETSVSFWLKFNGKKRSAVITRRNAEAPQGTTESCYLWMGRLNVELEPNEIVYIELK